MRFDYFYGKESDMMSFYRVPKLLIKDPYFRTLDNEAKFLYGLLLDRMDLSAKNGWYDEQHRVFIIYSQKKLMEDMNRGRNKISDMLSELEQFGLIERIKGKKYMPDKIYVKMYVDQQAERNTRNVMPEIQTPRPSTNMIRILPASGKTAYSDYQNGDRYVEKSYEYGEDDCSDDEEMDPVDEAGAYGSVFEMQTPDDDSVFEMQTPSCSNRKHMMFTSQTYTCPDCKHDDVYISNTNHTENNNTEYSHTESNQILSEPEEDEMGYDEEQLAQIVRENLEIDILKDRDPDYAELYEGVYDLVYQTVINRNPTIHIASNNYPTAYVREKFLKLNSMHVQYVVDAMKSNTTKVKKIDKYWLTALFNATTTMQGYYTAEFNHDMPQYAG